MGISRTQIKQLRAPFDVSRARWVKEVDDLGLDPFFNQRLFCNVAYLNGLRFDFCQFSAICHGHFTKSFYLSVFLHNTN